MFTLNSKVFIFLPISKNSDKITLLTYCGKDNPDTYICFAANGDIP